MRFLLAACDEYESSSPYYPFRALLREVAGLPAGGAPDEVLSVLEKHVVADDPDLVPLLPLLGVPLDIALPDTTVTAGLDEQFRKATVEQVVVRFLTATLTGPTVLVLDDVHWMDDASADLMGHLAAGPDGRQWLLLVTRRDVPTGYVPEGDDVVRLRPAPIDAATALALVEQSTQDVQLPPHVLEAIAQRAGGNPLFLRSLLEAARAGGLPSADSGDALPASVEGLLTSQVDRLSADERALLRYASVLGVTFAEEHLRQMLGDTPMPTTWASLRRLAGFLEPAGHGRFRFRHALIRAAAYEGLSFRRRRELHGRVGDLLEEDGADEQAELLSMHFFYAGRSDKAWHYSRVAGDRSRAKYAYVEAAEFYTRAVASARRVDTVDDAQLGRVWESLADAQSRAGDIEEARRSYRSARRIAPDRVAIAHLLLMEARLDRHQGRTTQSMRTLTRGMHPLGRRARDRRGQPRPGAARGVRVVLRLGTLSPGPLPGGRAVGSPGAGARGAGGREGRARRGLCGAAADLDGLAVRPRAAVRRDGPRGLRRARGRVAAGQHAEQPRRHGVLRGSMVGRSVAVRPSDAGLRAGRPPARGGERPVQPGGDPRAPGAL